MLVSLADEGKIYFEGLADDLAEELSLLIDEDAEAVRMALIFLEQKKLLTTSDNYQYNLEQVPELIGSETASTRRSRKYRETQKALQCNADATKRNGEIDIEIDKDSKQNDNIILRKMKKVKEKFRKKEIKQKKIHNNKEEEINEGKKR